MGQLIYSTIASLDGYTADRQGNFDWGAPDAEVHSFINDLERDVGTYLFGRRMYAVMSVWEDMGGAGGRTPDPGLRPDLAGGGQNRVLRHAGRRDHRPDPPRAGVPPGRTSAGSRTPRRGPSASAGPPLPVRRSQPGWWTNAGSSLFPWPWAAGCRFLPAGLAASFELLEQRRFASGVLYLRYAVRP